MEDIFNIVLTSSLYASVVGLVILLFKWVLKNKLNAQWHYLIWIVLIMKLLIPFGPESTVSLFNVIPEMPQQSMTEIAYQMEQQYKASLETKIPLPYEPSPQQQYKAATVAVFGEKSLPYVWTVGMTIILLWLIFTYYSIHRKLRKGSFDTNERILSILQLCKAKMGIDKDISLVLQDAVDTPSLYGIIRPKILLPLALLKLSDKEIEYILLHELAHIKQKDLHVNLLLLVFQIVHWFNPVLWYCFKRIREDMEVATDERVLSRLGNSEHKDYGRALLAVLEGFSASKLAPRLLGMVDDKKNIERRLKMIKMAVFFKHKRRLVFAVGLLCMVVLGGMLLTNGLTKQSLLSNSTTNNAEILYKYKTLYVGNSSKVGNIINNLPYADFRKEVSLQTQTVPYGITVNYDFSTFNMDTQLIEQTFRNNAVIMFALIDNVDVITFNASGTSEQPKYLYTRAQVQKSFDNDLRVYSKDVNEFNVLLKSLTFRLLVFPEKYTPTMSSTPGIRIIPKYVGFVGNVRYSTENGVLFTWDIPSGKLSKGMSTIELPYDTPVYWSPLNQNSQNSADKNNVVTVTILDEKGKKIDEKRVDIIYDGFYTVKSSLDVIIGTDSAQKPKNVNDDVSHANKISSADKENALKVVQKYFDAFAIMNYKTMRTLATDGHNKEIMHADDVWGMKWAKAEEIKFYDEKRGRLRFGVQVQMETVTSSALYPSTQTFFFIELKKGEDGVWRVDGYSTG